MLSSAAPRPSTEHSLISDKKQGISGINVAGWEIKSRKTAISSASEIDSTIEHLATLSSPSLHVVPDMYFGNNYLSLNHVSTGKSMIFNPESALERIQVGKEGERWRRVKVKAAEKWKWKGAKENMSGDGPETLEATETTEDSIQQTEKNVFDIEPSDIQETPKPYDWTLTTDYNGTLVKFNENDVNAEPELRIPLDKLTIPEPILFYDHVVLYEDELGDNGVSRLSVKIRVMPSSFFILLRHFLRIDDVMFSINDTRIYHTFSTNYLIREFVSKEVPYEFVRNIALQEKQADNAFTAMPRGGSSVLTGRNVLGLTGRRDGIDEPNVDVSPFLLDENWVGNVICPPRKVDEVADVVVREKIVLLTRADFFE